MIRVCAVVFLLLFSCNQSPRTGLASKKAFYFWQTSTSSFDWDDTVYQSLKVNRIYARFFDVDWSEEVRVPVPVSPLKYYYYNHWDDTVEMVPVVFITNETFQKLDKEQSRLLARQVHKKVMALLRAWFHVEEELYKDGWWQQNPYAVKTKDFNELQKHDSLYEAEMKSIQERIREVQFDCDWTKSTKDKYFAFLEETKKLFTQQVVSSTIRLYQYKYPKEAGLPPVGRGMLMCYNAGDIKDTGTKNSIFDKQEIMSYLDAGEYPIPLDYALPIFEWAVLYRDGKFKNILSASVLREEHHFSLKPEPDDRQQVALEDFVYGYTDAGILIRKGDKIRFEQPDMEHVKELAQWLAEHKNNQEAIVSFYHLNDHDLQKHSKAVESIFNSF
jgi:hypothetical protein